MVSVKEVEKLNERIEKINIERTKAKTRQEILQKKLDEELQEYKENFGVDLTGKTFKETKVKIEAEAKKVTSVVEEEYNLKLKVVSAIEDGDYEEAKRLLGIEEVKEEESVEEDMVEDVTTQENLVIEEDEEEEEDFGFGGLSIEDDKPEAEGSNEEEYTSENLKQGAAESSKSNDDEINSGAQAFLKAVNDTKVEEEPKKDKLGSVKEESKKDKLVSVEEAFSGLDANLLQVEDDDDFDEDFGFGDMLAGTKFE